jgi:hypothetical protein
MLYQQNDVGPGTQPSWREECEWLVGLLAGVRNGGGLLLASEERRIAEIQERLAAADSDDGDE